MASPVYVHFMHIVQRCIKSLYLLIMSEGELEYTVETGRCYKMKSDKKTRLTDYAEAALSFPVARRARTILNNGQCLSTQPVLLTCNSL